MSRKAIRMLRDILSANFTTHDITHIAKDVDRSFDIYEISGYPEHHNLFAQEAAEITCKYFYNLNHFKEFADYVISLNGKIYRGRQVSYKNLNEFINTLDRIGLEYNKNKKKVLFSEKNGLRNDFGDCQEGKEYEFTFLKIQIEKGNEIKEKYDSEIVFNTYKKTIDFIRENIEKNDGRLWSWSGDSGLAAFYYDKKNINSVYSAIEILCGTPIFNSECNPFNEDIVFKISIHSGSCIFQNDTKQILSQSINYVSHLLDEHTKSNCISISANVLKSLNDRIRRLFVEDGKFQENSVYSFSYKIGI